MMSYQVAKNLPIENKLNTIIQRLLESGLTNFYLNKCMFLIRLSGIITSQIQGTNMQHSNASGITMNNFQSFCIFYMIAMFIAVLTFIGELLYKRNKMVFGRSLREIEYAMHGREVEHFK